MLQDYELILADAASAVGTAAARTVATNIIDVSKVGGAVPGLYLCIAVTTQYAASGGAANVTFYVETHTAADFSAARTVLWTSAKLAKATLAAGYSVVKFRLPPELKRYIGVVQICDTNDITSGNYDAFLVLDTDVAASY